MIFPSAKHWFLKKLCPKDNTETLRAKIKTNSIATYSLFLRSKSIANVTVKAIGEEDGDKFLWVNEITLDDNILKDMISEMM